MVVVDCKSSCEVRLPCISIVYDWRASEFENPHVTKVPHKPDSHQSQAWKCSTSIMPSWQCKHVCTCLPCMVTASIISQYIFFEAGICGKRWQCGVLGKVQSPVFGPEIARNTCRPAESGLTAVICCVDHVKEISINEQDYLACPSLLECRMLCCIAKAEAAE